MSDGQVHWTRDGHDYLMTWRGDEYTLSTDGAPAEPMELEAARQQFHRCLSMTLEDDNCWFRDGVR